MARCFPALTFWHCVFLFEYLLGLDRDFVILILEKGGERKGKGIGL